MEQRNFFISYTNADSRWAKWIAWQLEAVGYSTWLEEWDFRPGSNFVYMMDEAFEKSERLIAVFSPAYLNSDYAYSECAAAFRRDPKGKQGLLLPILVEACDIKGLFGSIAYIDLVGLDEKKAYQKLLQGVKRGRNKPPQKPSFPGTGKPSFPPSAPSIQPTFSDKHTRLLAIRGRGNGTLRLPHLRTNLYSKKFHSSNCHEVNQFSGTQMDSQPTASLDGKNSDNIFEPIVKRASLLLLEDIQPIEEPIVVNVSRPIITRRNKFGGIASAITDMLSSWFVRIGLIVNIIILVAMMLIPPLLPSHKLALLYFTPNNTMATPSPSNTADNPSQRLRVLSQKDPNQYSPQEYNTWADSDSSAAAMAEVINAYGHQYRITDILKVEIQLQAITPGQGLRNADGITKTVEKFGFKANLDNRTLDQIINIANKGQPVIVSFPPNKYPGGHSLVVIGGSGNDVNIVDSNNPNQHSYTPQQFENYWGGFSAILTPN